MRGEKEKFIEQKYFHVFIKGATVLHQNHHLAPDIEMLGWCPVRSVLPHGEKVPL